MVCARTIFDFVLNKLETRKSDSVKRKMIRAARVLHRQRGRAHFAKRRKPLTKNRRDGGITLHIHAANLARAVIQIVISGKFVVIRAFDLFWFRLIRLRNSENVAAVFHLAEVIFDVI